MGQKALGSTNLLPKTDQKQWKTDTPPFNRVDMQEISHFVANFLISTPPGKISEPRARSAPSRWLGAAAVTVLGSGQMAGCTLGTGPEPGPE